MGLRSYHHKRNFSITTEPRGGKTTKHTPIFVVQLHHARRRHYDFRLQVGDVLKSWAVPKGPSFDPAIKRLAVPVEDHPLGYASFEGDIPAGQYGAGRVQIFDSGTWSPLLDPNLDNGRSKRGREASIARQLRKGHLQFTLEGGRLRGAWHLVRTRSGQRQPQWMLFKAHDEYAGKREADDLLDKHANGRAPQPRKRIAKRSIKKRHVKTRAGTDAHRDWTRRALALANATREKLTAGPFAPQLARSVPQAPTGTDWLHETKWDGYRLLTSITAGTVQLWSRNALEWTNRVPVIRNALSRLPVRSAQLDGELIAVTRDGKSDFNELQVVLAGESDAALSYAVFDLLHIDGVSLRDCTMLDRKELLRPLLQSASHGPLLYSEHHIGDGDHVFALAVEQGLEGIVSKRIAASYRAVRSDDWLKVKSVLSDEFAVVGYTRPRGTRRGVGALLLARPDARNSWQFVGRMGSGFSDVMLKKLGDDLPKLRTEQPSVTNESLAHRDVGRPIWITPQYVVEVYYRGFGKEGLLRQASLKALREDKSAVDLRVAPDTPTATVKTLAKTNSKRAAAKADTIRKTSKTKTAQVAVHTRSRVTTRATPAVSLDYISHPDRIVYPRDGITKLQVADYYEHVMPWLLPHIINRPLSLMRCPGNVKKCFFQKHHSPQLGERVQATRIRNVDGDTEEYLYVKDAEGVRELVQMNVLEFHPWGAMTNDVDNANFITFDLDPGPRVAWPRVIAAAELLHDLLRDVGLQSFVKTSGGKGLHVTVPLSPAQPWDQVKQSCKQVAVAVTQAHPKDFIDVATKAKRIGKIFIDYLRNGRGATSVAAYSLRARDGAPVSMPLEWRDIRETRSGADFTLTDAIDYLRKRKRDPWRNMNDTKQKIKI